MAYFSNSTEGAYFDNQCCECLLCDDDGTILCPILAVQMTFNYDQCGNEKLKEAMNLLVSEGGECTLKPIIDKLKAQGKIKPLGTQGELGL